MINSPRSLEACKRRGVEPSELYQLSEEEFRKKYPEVINFTQKILLKKITNPPQIMSTYRTSFHLLTFPGGFVLY